MTFILKSATLNRVSQKTQLSIGLILGIIAFLGFVLFTFFPSSAKADFWDDVVDFLDPTQHIGNILDGRPQDNLPPLLLPGFSTDRDSTTTVFVEPGSNSYYNNIYNTYHSSYRPEPRPHQTPIQVCRDTTANNYGGRLPCVYPPQVCQNPSAINYREALPCRYITPVPNPTVDIRADDTRIDFDDSTTIRWSSDNADDCRASGGANGWSGSISRSGSFDTGDLTRDVTYYITCTNSRDSDEDSVTVRVDDEDNNDDEPTVDIYANPANVNYNGSSTITWNSNDADSCRASGGTNGWSGSRSRSGSFFTGNLTNTTTFSINCSNDEGSRSDSVTVYVNNVQPVQTVQNPTVILSVDAGTVNYNGVTNLRWFTSNVTSCVASGGVNGWAGTRNIGPGSFYTGALTGTRTYTLTCSNNVASATDSVTVTVRGQTVAAVTPRPVTTTAAPTSLVLINSSIDRRDEVTSSIDNTRPRPGDEINYTIGYQNIGTGAITGLTLQATLPQEVNYMFTSGNNPMVFGNNLVFNLGTLPANSQGLVTIRARVGDDVPAGTNLNFPATLSYVNPSGISQFVNTYASAQVSEPASLTPESLNQNVLPASVFGAGFLPTNIFGWLLLFVLILLLVFISKHLFYDQSFGRRPNSLP